MLRIPKKTIPPLLRGLKIVAAVIATLQAATVTVIVAIDQLRKLRQTGKPGGYPQIKPQPIRVDRSCLKTYMDGETLYRDMLAAIEGAKERVFFETFIWKSDEIGQEFKDALIRAAERGAEVYIIWDRFGNMVVDPRFFRFPRLKNLHVLGYSLRHTARDHRKILVVDSKVGFVGGYNIGSYYLDNQWRDTHLRISGSNVWELESAFLDFWNYAQKWHLRLKKVRDPRAKSWNSKIQACVNDPKRLLFPVRGMYV
ncbi:phospholipase D-like domain-containing protein, partial [Varibaculum cambriense]